MSKAKITIEGLDYRINYPQEAYEIVKSLPIYEVYVGEKTVVKENAGVVKKNCDYMVYDIASLSLEEKAKLKEILGDKYKPIEVKADQKKEMWSLFPKKDPEVTTGNTIEYYIGYPYVHSEIENPEEFIQKYCYKGIPCFLREVGDYISKKPEEYVKASLLEINAPDEYYRLIGDLIPEIEQIVDPNEILELVKIGERKYADPKKLNKNRSK